MIKRRDFIKNSGVAFGGLLASSAFLNSCNILPSQKITLGMIGVGGHGYGHNLKSFLRMKDVQVLAVCDVDKNNLMKAKNAVDKTYGNKDCSVYDDFRDLLLRPDIDAVMISTPDHWHVPISILAAQAGKDICCEKPSLTIHEGRALCDVIEKTGVIYQTSIEDRALSVYVQMVQMVREGRIGELKNIHIELPEKAFGPNFKLDTKPCKPPKELNYDMWLGPAPYQPYSPARTHWNFRWNFDYSGGKLTDWGTHLFDTANWINNTDKTGPAEIEGKGTFYEHPVFNTAYKFDIRYKYDNSVNMFVKSGGIKIRCEGSEGWIVSNRWKGKLESNKESIISPVSSNDLDVYTAPSEHQNFIDCVKSRKECFVPAEVGHRIASALHMGNISMQLGRKLEWNSKKEQFIDDDQANKMLVRESRDPWKLENIIT